MNIKRIEAGPLMANCYILSNESNDGIMIDPVYPGGVIEDYINRNNINIKAILLTHTHFDHVLGLDYFKNKYKAKIYAAKEAELIANDPFYNLSSDSRDNFIEIDEYLDDGDKIEYFDISVLKTPGHSLDSVSYLIDGNIFSGDTLFRLSVGRSDFAGGNHKILINSIMTKLMVFDDSTKVYPGHGQDTTIGFEKLNNPFL